MADPPGAGSGAGSTYEPLNWMDVGEPPAAVEEWRRARMKTFRRVSSVVGGFGIGGLAGYLGFLLWPGTAGWTLTTRVELFLGVAVVVGVTEFFVSGRLADWVSTASLLKVRRVAVAGTKLRIERISGTTFEWPLKRVYTSPREVAAGWHAVSLAAGRVTMTFYAPGLVASTIANAPRE